MMANLSIVTIVNDQGQYSTSRRSLERQGNGRFLQFIPIDADGVGINASTALNRGLAMAESEWVLLVHQDVIFPIAWLDRFVSAMESLPPATAVAGLVGIRPNGAFVGHVKDPHGHHRWLPMPASVVSLDEHCLAVRKSSGLLFDETCPGFHCYGTDICLSAREHGFLAMVIDAPVIHLSGGRLDASFDLASRWLLAKWGPTRHYVISTCAILLREAKASNLFRLLRARLKQRKSFRESFCRCDCSLLDDAEPYVTTRAGL